MRRFRTLSILLLALAGLILPAAPNASAQVPSEVLSGVITGSTRTPTAPHPTDPQDRCGSFDQVAISVAAARADGRLTTGVVEQPDGQNVGFCTTETLLEGRGTLTATNSTNAFRNRANNAVEIHGAESGLACIELRIVSGEFERVGNVAVARIEIDVHAKRAVIDEDCHGWDGDSGASWRETLCGEAVVTATPNPADLTEAVVAGVAELGVCV